MSVASVIILSLDRLVKVMALRGIRPSAFSFVGFPRFALYKNTAAAFSIPLPIWFVVGVSTLVLIGVILLIVWTISHKRWTEMFGYLTILLGASSNFFDRIHYGYVIDMIEVLPGSFWNIADGLIIIGVLLLFITHFKKGTTSQTT